MPSHPRYLYTEAGTVALDPSLNPFDADYPYSYCRICGFVYQPAAQRATVLPIFQLPNAPNDSVSKQLARCNAMVQHERQHEADGSLDKYNKHYAPGFTPEAAHRLVPYGIIPLSDMVLNHEVEHAANTAPRAPYPTIEQLED